MLLVPDVAHAGKSIRLQAGEWSPELREQAGVLGASGQKLPGFKRQKETPLGRTTEGLPGPCSECPVSLLSLKGPLTDPMVAPGSGTGRQLQPWLRKCWTAVLQGLQAQPSGLCVERNGPQTPMYLSPATRPGSHPRHRRSLR